MSHTDLEHLKLAAIFAWLWPLKHCCLELTLEYGSLFDYSM
jgi:hypothetical protein